MLGIGGPFGQNVPKPRIDFMPPYYFLLLNLTNEFKHYWVNLSAFSRFIFWYCNCLFKLFYVII